MKTNCIKYTLEEYPMDVLKGCIALMGSLDAGYAEDIHSHLGISVLADVMRDAVNRIEEKKERVSK